ncbi:MAG: hypothetical protein CMM50_13375 [Rhodospirillaceae bacterium]|nr:hypothetical protein [Rhodospirillaceae bacterium]
MSAELLAGIEASHLAATLRGSTWLYPLVNTAHIYGIALLFGAIVPLDLRLMGVWRTMPVAMLARLLVPVAATGFGLAAVAGALLFSAQATDYAASGFFRAKMAMLAFALANLFAVHAFGFTRDRADPPRLRFVLAAISLGAWLTVILLGRLVGYF